LKRAGPLGDIRLKQPAGILRSIETPTALENIMWNLIKAAVARSNEKARLRHASQTMIAMDDKMLRDIGMQRGDIRDSVRNGRHFG
jgi:hypothetical protein